METHFAPPERAPAQELEKTISVIKDSTALSTLMTLTGGLVAVLNKHRQVLAVNQAYLDLLGIPDAESVLGLRPGETLKCSHANDMPGGCGTTMHCVTCGAAIAIVSCQELQHPVEQKCMITTKNGSITTDKFFLVRANAFSVDGESLTLLFLQDATMQQNRIALERVFLHDLSNLAGSILGAAQVMAVEPEDPELHYELLDLSRRLAREIKAQRAVFNNDLNSYEPIYSSIPVEQALREIKTAFANNEVAQDKSLEIHNNAEGQALSTDYVLLIRILENMVENAFEATEPGGIVKIAVKKTADRMIFSIWNEKGIPHPQSLRIFQRNFSTKKGLGHGLGTYCMKMFGEQVLGGDVWFTSSFEQGTTFFFSLPV